MLKDSIKYLRKLKGLSQQELANKLGISFKTVSHWESGYSEPSIELLKKLKIVLDATYEELID